MTTTIGNKDLLDLPMWRPTAIAPTATSAGTAICGDLRGSDTRGVNLYYLATNALLYKYNFFNNEWITLASPAITNALGAGSDMVHVPHIGPQGTLSAGCSTTSLVLNTSLPAAVGVNQLANRGDGTGYKIRVIGKSSGGSGKTEETYITSNTGGSTPTLTVSPALSFTPASTDGYEILSGKLYILGTGAIGSGTFRSYDIATNSYATLAQANLPTTISTDSHMVSTSEVYNPASKKCGEGIITGAGTYNGGTYGCLTATAAAAGTLTGQSSGGDFVVFTNEYRNFQIRIVEDASTPTAVGQRRRIASHTGSGVAPVYTLASNWTVTPSATCKYVLEYNGDNILLFTTGNGNTYNYSIAGNAWDVSTTWAVRGANMGAGCCGHFAFGAERDPTGNNRHSFLHNIRGGNVNTIDVFDIAGASTGSWSLDIVYGNKGLTAFSTGTCGVASPNSQGGKYYYMNLNGTQRNIRYDMVNRRIEPYGYLEFPQGTAVVGRRVALPTFYDGTTVIPFLTLQRASAAEMFQVMIVS